MNDDDKKLNNENILYIYNGIKSEIEKLGLNIAITETNKFGHIQDADRISITHNEYDDFHAEILAREWNDKDRASLWFNTMRERSLVGKPYSDGSSSSHSHKYEFDYMLSDKELETIGLKQIDYRRSLSQLRVGFKATKNIKLILKDILPSIKMYLEIVKQVKTKIDEKIERENHIFELQKRVNKYDDYKHTLYDLGNREFTTPIGRIKISEYGSIQLTQELTEDQLMALLEK